jgi:hypothetical protein
MTDFIKKDNSLTDKINADILNSYSEYLKLIKKYRSKFIDKKINYDSNIDLKSLMLEYFNFKLENGEKWIKDLILIINGYKFPSQNALISIFYLDEIDLIIKPKILQLTMKEKFYPQSKIFSYPILQKVDGEIIDPTILYKIKRQESYELFDVIKKQIESKENPFNIIINNFIDCFLNEVNNRNNHLEKLKANKDYNVICNKIFKELKEQINEFTILLTKSITLLYKINNIQEFDTYYALLISFIFTENSNSKKLYKLLMNIIDKKESDKNNKFRKIISYYKNKNLVKPEDFSVEDKFCLNEKSKSLYETNFNKEYNINLDDNHIPYKNVINNYKKIRTYRNPFDKLILTMNLSKNIQEDISKFWSLADEKELKDDHLKLNIEADDFISIFKYMLIKGEIDDIHSQISFIESFTSNQIKSESEWYYLSLMQVSLLQLEENKEVID